MRLVHWRCTRMAKLWRVVRQTGSAPYVFEIFVACTVLCVFLIIDVLWLSASHKIEIDRIMKSNAGRLGEFRKEFDAQVKHVDAEHRNKEILKIDQHKKDVNRVRDLHQQQIEQIVSSIQQQLDDLKDLSKAYWDQHAVADA